MTRVAVTSAVPAARPSDAELLSALADADDGRAALDELARRYVDFVYAAACRQMHDRHAAEDVTQAVFLVLARRGHRVRPPALACWLHQATRYAAANARRAARRRRTHEARAARPEATMPYVLPEPDPLLPLLDDAIASLGSKDRTAVIDRYLRGRDVATIAAALRVTPAAAQKRLERAVVRLRKYFVRAGVPTAAAAVAVTLASVAPTPASAAPAALAGGLSQPAAAPALTLKGMLAMLTGTQIKVAAGLLLATGLLAGAGVEVARHGTTAATPGTTPVAADVLAGAGGGTDERGTPLTDVFARLGRTSGRQIFVDWDTLRGLGLGPDTPVTVDLTGLSLRDALWRVLGTLEPLRLSFGLRDDVITVTTAANLDLETLNTRVYDVRFFVPANTPDADPRVGALLRRVRGVYPLTWKDNGGAAPGRAQYLSGQLIVTQTAQMHARLAAELGRDQPAAVRAALRAVVERTPPPQSPASAPATASTPVGRTVQRMGVRAASYRVEGVALRDALDQIARGADVMIDPQWDALAASGIRPDTPTTVRVKNASWQKNLAVVLDSVVPAGKPSASAGVRDDGHVVVTTRQDLFARFATTRTYGLGELIARLPPGEAAGTREQVMSLLRETVAPASWAKADGEPGGTLSVEGDVLRVVQTPDVQAQVADVLARLRAQATPQR